MKNRVIHLPPMLGFALRRLEVGEFSLNLVKKNTPPHFTNEDACFLGAAVFGRICIRYKISVNSVSVEQAYQMVVKSVPVSVPMKMP